MADRRHRDWPRLPARLTVPGAGLAEQGHGGVSSSYSHTSGSPAPTASFVLDASTNTFTNFTVEWDGATFDFDGASTTDMPHSGYWCAEGPFYMLPPNCFSNAGVFSFSETLDNGLPIAAYDGVGRGPFTDLTAFAYGDYTMTESAVPTPEPETLVLLGLGLFGVGLSRRRARTRG